MRRHTTAPTRRDFPLADFKALDEQTGTFKGYLSVFGNQDMNGEIVDAGAFAKTLTELRAKQAARGAQGAPSARYLLPILWDHNTDTPIGGFTVLREDGMGLYVEGELDLNTEQGRIAYSGFAKGYIPGLSIGYFTLKATFDRAGVRHLKEVALFEGSVVSIPANQEALILQIKDAFILAASGEGKAIPMPTQQGAHTLTRPQTRQNLWQGQKAMDFTTALQAVSADDTLQDEWGDSFQALVSALWSVMVMGDQPGDSGAQDAADTVLEQFSAAMSDLVKRSLAAQFCPSLDDDGDSFLDPDGPNAVDADECAYAPAAYMSRDTARAETKAGRVMSAANHKAFGGMLTAMKKSMDDLAATHQQMKAFHAKVDPNAAKPDADAASNDAGARGDATSSDATASGKALNTAPDTAPADTADTTGAGSHTGGATPLMTPLAADEMGRLIRVRMAAAAQATATV